VRIRVGVTTSATVIPWDSVLAPGRSLVYDVLARTAPALGEQVHRDGWGSHRMAPWGHGAPVFPKARRIRGSYAAGGSGMVEFGSPVPQVVEALGQGLARCEVVDWGGVALRLTGLTVVEAPPFTDGRAVFRTVTPVVMKGSGRNGDGARTTRQEWLLPGEPSWPEYFQGNLARKAETLGLKPEVQVESVDWIGPKRSFRVGEGAKPGCPVEVTLSGEPEVLGALWSWGLGQANSAGFGWITA
jgi:CRISPR-associated endoribonuclease Cas6